MVEISNQVEGNEPGYLGDLESLAERKAKFDSMSFDDFKTTLVKLNAKVRGINPALHDFDGSSVVVGDLDAPDGPIIEHRPPDKTDKPELLQYLLSAAQNLPDIQDAALLIAAGINQIHPFADGNGRLSRFMYVNMAAGGEFLKQHSEEVLNSRSSIDIGSALPSMFLEKMAGARLGEGASDREVRAETLRVLCDAFLDPKSVVMYPDDVPLKQYKPTAQTGLALRDYLVSVSSNLLSSRLAKKSEWKIDPETNIRSRTFVGYQEDSRFKKDNQ